jgi:hypothetical protein
MLSTISRESNKKKLDMVSLQFLYNFLYNFNNFFFFKLIIESLILDVGSTYSMVDFLFFIFFKKNVRVVQELYKSCKRIISKKQ